MGNLTRLDRCLENISDELFEKVEDARADTEFQYNDPEFAKIVGAWLGDDFYEFYKEWYEEGED